MADTKVEQAVKEICKERLTPGFYLGVKDKSVDKTSSFWRNFIFPSSQDIVHDKKYMFWDEFRRKYPTLMPTDICPCDEGDYLATSDSSIQRMVSQGYWWLGFPLDCDWEQFLRPGECPYNAESFARRLEDYFLDLRDKLFMGFDQKEEYWAAMMAMNGSITINPKGGKPYELKFERDCDLECVITDPACMWCHEPKKGDSVTARPWDDFRYMQEKIHDKNRGFFDTAIMSRRTCNWLRNAVNAEIKRCKDAGTVQILMPAQLRLAGVDLPLPQDGATLEFAMEFGNRRMFIYCVDTNFVFCDENTGEEVCVNPMKDGKVYFYNINGGGTNQFGGRFAFGRIHNFNATEGMQKRFFHQHITDSGKSLKYHGESAPTVLIECPNGSACLDVCGGNPPPKTTTFEDSCSIKELGEVKNAA